jgi:hypothetical protein
VRSARIQIVVALTTLLGVASGCAGAAAGTSAGISGRAELGPICPVQRPGVTCTRPYQTTLIVYSAAHHRRIKKLHTDRNGRFHTDIAPGRYVITGAHHGLAYPVAHDARVIVRPHRVTHVTISFDTGIR